MGYNFRFTKEEVGQNKFTTSCMDRFNFEIFTLVSGKWSYICRLSFQIGFTSV